MVKYVISEEEADQYGLDREESRLAYFVTSKDIAAVVGVLYASFHKELNDFLPPPWDDMTEEQQDTLLDCAASFFGGVSWDDLGDALSRIWRKMRHDY